MKITPETPDAVYVLALDDDGVVIPHLAEIDTDCMEGYRIGMILEGPAGHYFEPVPPSEIGAKYLLRDLHREVMPVKIAKLLDSRTGGPWRV